MGPLRGVSYKLVAIFVCLSLFSGRVPHASGKKKEISDDPGEKWKKKDVRDYTDADLERLFEQWEVCLHCRLTQSSRSFSSVATVALLLGGT